VIYSAGLTETEVRKLADAWFVALNDKAALRPMVNMLAPEGLVMKFPETTVHGIEGFKGWRRDVRHKFFDQSHTIRQWDVRLDGSRAHVSVVVRWEASTWQPPAARSERIVADAGQTWTVVRWPGSGRAVIQLYSVDTFTPIGQEKP